MLALRRHYDVQNQGLADHMRDMFAVEVREQ